MHFLLFNSGVFISDGRAVRKITKDEDLRKIIEPVEKVRICYVDVDVLIASAPEDYFDKKDSLLAQKFKGQYLDEYVTLDEKIDKNIFQVTGIKSQKVKEIYSLIPNSKVDSLLPYAVAIRSLLINEKKDMKKSIIFVDDLKDEKLITVFDGLKFSRTRTISTEKLENILPDIKRSYIDFNKKLGEFTGNRVSGDFTIITNNQQLAEDIKLSEEVLAVEFLNCEYPALEGLKYTGAPIKYRIHEEIIRDRKSIEWRSRLMFLTASVGICMAAALFWGFNQIKYSLMNQELKQEKLKSFQLEETLNQLDQEAYRDFLKKSKSLNYSSVFLEMSGLLPVTYEISSFKFTQYMNNWVLDTYIFAQDDEYYDEIPRIKILKKAQIKDFFIKSHPGKHIKISL